MLYKTLKIFIVILLTVLSLSTCEKDNLPSNVNQNNESNIKGSISNEDAGIFAINFMKNNSKLKATLSVNSIKEFRLPFKNRKLYMVNLNPDGFVLISDNMQDMPVFAYSETGDFNYTDWKDLPPGVKEWCSEFILNNYQLEKDTILQKLNEIKSKWDSYLPKFKSTEIIDPDECVSHFLGHSHDEWTSTVLTTSWDQNEPYNNGVPVCVSTGEHDPAGCVAVAMGQVMKYWNHPSYFNWSLMPNYITTSSPSSNIFAISSLLLNIGIHVNMNYGCNGSSASAEMATATLGNFYGYSNAITHASWHIDDIRENIQWGYPVIAGGYRTRTTILGIDFYTNGHAWVIDGLKADYDNFEVVCYSGGGIPLISYETRNYIETYHINWGWGNYSGENIWYSSNNLTTPFNIPDKNYQWNKDMIVKIHP